MGHHAVAAVAWASAAACTWWPVVGEGVGREAAAGPSPAAVVAPGVQAAWGGHMQEAAAVAACTVHIVLDVLVLEQGMLALLHRPALEFVLET